MPKARRIINTVGIALFAAMLVFYSAGRARDMLTGPEIAVISPTNGKLLESDLVVVSGYAKNISRLELNGQQIFVDEEESGLFEERLLLHYGYNIIEIAAKDRFGTVKTETLRIVYQ